MRLEELTVESNPWTSKAFTARATFAINDITTIKKLEELNSINRNWFPFTEDEIVDFSDWNPFTTGCFPLVPKKEKKEAQVYVNGDVTTLKVGDKVYHSRPEKGEKFDLEKGILVCIAKASGYSTSDVLKLRENAKQHRKVAKKNTKNKKK